MRKIGTAARPACIQFLLPFGLIDVEGTALAIVIKRP